MSADADVDPAFFRTLTERSPVVVTVVGPDGTWRWSSQAGVRLHGPLEPGTPIERIFPAEYRDALLALVARTAQDGTEAHTVDLQLDGADGRRHALTVAAENLTGDPRVRGVVLYATATTRQVETKQRVRLESARLETLIASLGTGILLQGADQSIVLVNKAFTSMFGIPADPGSLTGRPVAVLHALVTAVFVHPEDVGPRADEIVASGQPVTGEELTLADGRIVERDYVPVHLDGATHGHLWVFRDVTEERLVVRGLEERSRALAELAKLKTEFIATASHELRTPLTSILTFAHLMEEPDCGPQERDHAMGAIARSADRMLQLVDDLILLASLEAGTAPLRLTPVDLPAVLRTSIQTWTPVAAKAGVELAEQVEDGPRLSADSRHLGQLVDTLLATAVATTPRGGKVAVSASFDDPDWVIQLTRSSATSTAPGGDHIFTRQGRQDDPATAHSNALAFLLSRAVVARHGGQLTSPEIMGAAGILVRLPLEPPPDASTLDEL